MVNEQQSEFASLFGWLGSSLFQTIEKQDEEEEAIPKRKTHCGVTLTEDRKGMTVEASGCCWKLNVFGYIKGALRRTRNLKSKGHLGEWRYAREQLYRRDI